MQRLWFESYLAMIKNSVGTEMFKSFFVEDDGSKRDIFNYGELSCAYFVSSILYLFQQQEKGHATVSSCIKDLEKHGWEKVSRSNVLEGDVVVWEPIEFEEEPGVLHAHIGFCLSGTDAVSINYKEGVPQLHSLILGSRRIEAIYSGKAQFAKLPQPS